MSRVFARAAAVKEVLTTSVTANAVALQRFGTLVNDVMTRRSIGFLSDVQFVGAILIVARAGSGAFLGKQIVDPG